MGLSDRYQPNRLEDIVGQPVIRHLKHFASAPHKGCIALEGSGGVGKSSAAYALARALGAKQEDFWSGLFEEKCADFGVDQARGYFESSAGKTAPFRMRPMNGWNVLILEEMEFLSPQCVRYLKVALDGRNLPDKAVVIATSNDLSKLERPFLQRFEVYRFSSGRTFADACVDRLAQIWQAETGLADLPAGWRVWGWDGADFSMRAAIDDLGRAARDSDRQLRLARTRLVLPPQEEFDRCH